MARDSSYEEWIKKQSTADLLQRTMDPTKKQNKFGIDLSKRGSAFMNPKKVQQSRKDLERKELKRKNRGDNAATKRLQKQADAYFNANPKEELPETPVDNGLNGPIDTSMFRNYGSFLEQMGATNDGRLASLYASAADYIRNMQGDVSGVFTKAADSYKDSSNSATNMINSGYGIARQQQDRSLKALGIEDAAAVIAASGNDPMRDQGFANSRVAGILGSNLDRNTANQTGALQALLAQASGVQADGARARAAYQQAISRQLAENELSRGQFEQEQIQGNNRAATEAATAAEEARIRQEMKAAELALKYPQEAPFDAASYEKNLAARLKYYLDQGLSENEAAKAAQRDASLALG